MPPEQENQPTTPSSDQSAPVTPEAVTPVAPPTPEVAPASPTVSIADPVTPITSSSDSGSSSSASSAYPVNLSAEYPESQSRGLGVLGILGIRALLLLPHLIAIYILIIIGSLLSWINFFIIAFTGKSSPALHKFLVGVQRWSTRVGSYSLGITDKYPPFKLDD